MSAATRDRVFKTQISFNVGGCAEHEVDAVVQYCFTLGYSQTWDEPGASDGAEIVSVQINTTDGAVDAPEWMLSLVQSDATLLDVLIAEAIEHDAGAADDAAERRHDERRSELCAARGAR